MGSLPVTISPSRCAVPQVFDIGVAAADMAGSQAVAGNTRQGVERQMNRHVVRRRIQQRNKLAFRCLERLVGHVVDQADLDTAAGFGVKQRRASVSPFVRDQDGGVERLLQICDDVVDVLDADAEANHFRHNAGVALLFRRHLPVSGGGRMAR